MAPGSWRWPWRRWRRRRRRSSCRGAAELGRSLSERAHHGVMVEVDWERLPAGEETLKALASALERTGRALAGSDQAVLQLVTTVRMVAEGEDVRRDGAALAIPMAAGLDGNLREALERALAS